MYIKGINICIYKYIHIYVFANYLSIITKQQAQFSADPKY